jgi:hypothetical protein
MQKRANKIGVFLFFTLGLFYAFSGFCAVPDKISFQGRLTDSTGTAVDDGSYTMKFIIYDAATEG